MRLAVSNIAWQAHEDDEVLEVLRGAGVDAIEVAPRRLFDNPRQAGRDDALHLRDAFAASGFQLVAMQALLYGEPELTVFGNAEAVERTRDYLKHIIGLAGAMGCRPLVFGSPKNRLKGGLSFEEAKVRAARFFEPLARQAAEQGCVIALEPNAADYGCDFVRRLDEACQVATLVGSCGMGIQLDAGVLQMEQDDLDQVARCIDKIVHVHASAPYLAHVEENEEGVRRTIARLKRCGYDGMISIEMRSQDHGNAARVARAVALMRDVLDAA